MQEPKEIAIAALRKMLSNVGPDAEFPGDAIWEYADEEVDSLRKPPVFKALSTEGYIQDTGEKTNAVTPDRRSAPTTKYRFGHLLRPTSKEMNGTATVAHRFATDCKGVLRVSEVQSLRLCTSLLSKRFLILTGLAGSGKTKIAQAFARWMTPTALAADPFRPGTTLRAARKEYAITDADRLSVEFANDDGTKVLLPRAIIEQWSNHILENGIPDSIRAQDLRDQIKKAGAGEYSDYLQNFETHYKPAALALIKARQILSEVKCYEVIPVGADWTGTENIVGYPNGLDAETYVTRPALELIRQALDPEFAKVPHFLILDEMNLSHVERYFADILSAVESEEEIPLYDGIERKANGRAVPRRLRLPKNLFIIGTVNVDETTYMFSPKVLDRANVIEFRMESEELTAFLGSPRSPRLEDLDGKGTAFGQKFVETAADNTLEVPASVKAEYESEMLLIFNLLRQHNAEFGYRTGYEAARFIYFFKLLGGYSDDNNDWFKSAIDAVIVQKILPKLHGSRSKLEGLLWALAWACGAERGDRAEKDFVTQLNEARTAQDEAKYSPDVVWAVLREKSPADPAKAAHYPLSFDKVMRMWRKLVRDQFVSFAEA